MTKFRSGGRRNIQRTVRYTEIIARRGSRIFGLFGVPYEGSPITGVPTSETPSARTIFLLRKDSGC
jgi:hypothetical protein